MSAENDRRPVRDGAATSPKPNAPTPSDGAPIAGDFDFHAPAPSKLWREIHLALADAGQTLRPGEAPPFAIVRRDPQGGLVAAASGEISFTSLHVSHLFVAEPARGRGMGTALLKILEAYGRARKCDRIHLETRSEDALRLYLRRGYRVFGELPRYAGAQSLYFLEKTL